MLNVQGIGQSTALLTSVADGDRGTRQIIRYAKQLVAEGLRSPPIHEMALAFCKAYGVQSYDERGELNAIFDGVLANFDYRKHVVGAQSLQPISGMLRTRSGDCAELNLILLPALLGTIGYPTRAVAIKADSSRPADFSHVYIEAMTSDGDWIPMDVARQGTQFGVEPERYWQREEFDMTPTAEGYMNGYRMPRGMGAQVVLIRKKSVFPRRGLGDAASDFLAANGITQDQYNADQADYAANSTAAVVTSTPSGPSFTTQFLAAEPSILTGVAQVVKAANTPGVAYSGVGLPTSGTAAGTGVAVTGSSAWVVLAILAVVGIAMFGKGRG